MSNTTAKNPWVKETINLTEQCRIRKSDPARAKLLEQQARNANPPAVAGNPFISGTLTDQARLFISDPVKAASLRAAAKKELSRARNS